MKGARLQYLLFTKLLKTMDLDQVAEIAGDLGFGGIDLLIRQGYQVEPTGAADVRDALRRLARHGLAVPVLTTDIVEHNPVTEALLEAAATAGVRLVRLGYWQYDGSVRYQTALDRARRDLEAIVVTAERYGVRPVIQLHGGTIHSSGSLTAALMAGYEPAVLGSYPDPGNQVVQDGREDWKITFDILQSSVSLVGVKNGGWSPGAYDHRGQRQWVSDWLGIADGMVPWDQVLQYLVQHHPDVPLSFHSHYEVPLAQALDHTRVDLRYVKRIVADLQSDVSATQNSLPNALAASPLV
jgi:sugar phosphate isomerase/epimerase